MKNSLKTAGAACLAVGLVSTWDTPADAQATPYGQPISFSGAITPSENLYAVYFILAAGPCSPAYNKLISEYIPANTTTTFNITFNSIYSVDGGATPWVGNEFTVMGLYAPTNGGVSLGFNPTEASSILSTSPAPVYDNGPWTTGYNTSSTESAAASVLENQSYGGQPLDDSSNGGLVDPNAGSYYYWAGYGTDFYSKISTDPNNPSDFTLIDFSGAAAAGSGYAVEVVPEPTTVSLLALAALSCGWLRRRNAGC